MSPKNTIYIPAVSRLDDHTKLSGPSALRDLINSVLKKIMDTSPAYVDLKNAFDEFNGRLKNESTESGHSLQSIEDEISNELRDWGTSFEFLINPISPDDMVKTLISHQIQDKVLGQALDSKCYGQGFQRHLVFTLIKLSAKYNVINKPTGGKDFSPQLTWLLFEEPEAFLHPSQIDLLDINLRTIANVDGNQVLITTHNPEFVSKNMEDIPSLIRLCRDGVKTTVGQITSEKLRSIFFQNQKDVESWLKNPKIQICSEDLTEDMESIKYALWLDSRRSRAFFALKVLLVEGPTETALLDYVFSSEKVTPPAGGIFVLDCFGKYNIHRFMNLFGEMKILHGVLFDNDNGRHPEIDSTIESTRNKFTLGIERFPEDIECFLGITPAGRPDRKPQHVIWNIHQNRINKDRLQGLVDKVKKALRIE